MSLQLFSYEDRLVCECVCISISTPFLTFLPINVYLSRGSIWFTSHYIRADWHVVDGIFFRGSRTSSQRGRRITTSDESLVRTKKFCIKRGPTG